MPHSSIPLRSLALAAFLFLISTTSQAIGFDIDISSPLHGQEMRATSAFFDDVNQEILVNGWFTGVDANNIASYSVTVNGQQIFPNFNNGVATFNTVLPAPTSLSVDSRRLFYPITAVIVEVASSEVVALDRILLYDARKDDRLDSQRSGQISRSLAAQLTSTAIDELEPVHLSSLPSGGLTAFNTSLATEAQGEVQDSSAGTYGDPGAICLSASEFTGTAAYNDAFAAATTQKIAYDAAVLVKNNPAGFPWPVWVAALAYTNSACVTEWPAAGDFVACVGTIESELSDLEIQSVSSVDLLVDWTNPGAIDAETELSDILAHAEGRLRDVTIFWNGLPDKCSSVTTIPARPSADVDSALLLSDPGLAAWSTCTDLTFDADSALSDAASYDLGFSASQPEEVELTRTTSPSFTLQNPGSDSGSQTCSDPAASADIEALLLTHQSGAESVLESVWEDTTLQHTTALETLLARLELGTYEPADHRLDLELETLTSFSNIDNSLAIEEGLTAFWNTDAEALAPLFSGSPSFLYSPERDELRWGQNELDHKGHPFEASFTVTTGALNQVIGALSMTELLWLDHVPTWQELGLNAADFGYIETDPVPMTGDVLGKYFAEFNAFGANTVRILVRPTLIPFLWIHPDPPFIGPGLPRPDIGKARLTYQLGQLEVDIIEDGPGGTPSTTWFRGWFDLYDETFKLSLDPQSGALHLNAAFSVAKESGLIAHHTEIPGCNLGVIGAANPCVDAIDDLVRPVIQEALISFVSEYPAPQFWDADGTAGITKHIQQSTQWQWDQKVTFFSRLP